MGLHKYILTHIAVFPGGYSNTYLILIKCLTHSTNQGTQNKPLLQAVDDPLRIVTPGGHFLNHPPRAFIEASATRMADLAFLEIIKVQSTCRPTQENVGVITNVGPMRPPVSSTKGEGLLTALNPNVIT